MKIYIDFDGVIFDTEKRVVERIWFIKENERSKCGRFKKSVKSGSCTKIIFVFKRFIV